MTIAYRNAEGPVTPDVILLDNFLDDPHGAIDSLTARALRVDFEKRLPSKIKDALPSVKWSSAARKRSPTTGKYADYIRPSAYDPLLQRLNLQVRLRHDMPQGAGAEGERIRRHVPLRRANENYLLGIHGPDTRTGRLWHFRSPDYTYISRMTVEPIQRSGNIRTSIYATPGSDFRKARFERIEAPRLAPVSPPPTTSQSDYQNRTFTTPTGTEPHILW